MRRTAYNRIPALALTALLMLILCFAPASASGEATATIRAQVTLTGTNAPEDTVSLLLEPQSGAPAPSDVSGLTVTLSEAAPQAEASCSIAFTSPGDYRYILRQQAGSAENMRYDDAAFTVVVRALYTNDDLTAVWWVELDEGAKGDSIQFENTYQEPEPEPTPTPAPILRIRVTGEKVWEDEDNAHHTRPDSVQVRLYADGERLDAAPTWYKPEGNVWYFTFDELPEKDESGNVIQYTVVEEPVENYAASVDKTTITNTLIPHEPGEYVTISGLKKWEDNDNAKGLRPGKVTVYLLRDGEVVNQMDITREGGWRYAFENLPADDGYGNPFEYAVRESAVSGYYAWIDGYDIVNRLIPDEPDIPEGKTPPFERFTEEKLEELLEIFDYNTPLWGTLLQTGDEMPVYPFVFAGIGCAAVILLIALGRRKKEQK